MWLLLYLLFFLFIFKLNTDLKILIKLVFSWDSPIKILIIFFTKLTNPISIGTPIKIVDLFFEFFLIKSRIFFWSLNLKCSKTSRQLILLKGYEYFIKSFFKITFLLYWRFSLRILNNLLLGSYPTIFLIFFLFTSFKK